MGHRGLRDTMMAAAVIAVLAPVAVHAQAIDFDLPAQSLEASLKAVSRRSGANIIFAPATVAGQTAARLKGSFTARDAVSRLIARSGLAVSVNADGTILIRATSATRISEETGVDAEAESDAEIVVTAQKRSEKQRTVPISISVVGGRQMEQFGAGQLTDVGPYIPGLQIDSTGTPGQATVSLRGIAPIGESTTVGTYLDDAPVGASSIYARSAGFTLDLLPYDIERIEVLRGPQGTLYGASSIGGLLKYVTVSPRLDDVLGKAGGEVFGIRGAGHAGYAGQAMVNLPIVQDRLGLTASYAYRKAPGYVDSLTTGKRDENGYEQRGGRVSLLWKPTDTLSVKLSGLWQTIDADGNANVVEDLVTGERIGNGLSNNNYLPESFRKTLNYYAATIDYDLGFAALTAASSYNRTRTRHVRDTSRAYGVLFPLFGAPVGLAPFTLDLDMKKFTQEVRLTSPTNDRFEWLIGGFFTHEKTGQAQRLGAFDMNGNPLPGLNPLAIASLPARYREYAVFGNATYKLSDRFDVTGGLRWARNEQSFRQISSGAIVPTANTPGTSAENVATYSVSPRFHLNRDTMLYARVASGYRPGGPNVVLPGVPSTVDSDSLVNYEIGLKSLLFDRSVTLDIAAFYMDWKDIQLLVNFAGGTSGFANAGSARSQGFEATIAWRPIDGLTLGANGAYTDAQLTADAPPSLGGRDGDRLPRIPKFSGALTADYRFRAADNAEMQIGAGLRHTGRRLSDVTSANPLLYPVVADAYSALDLNAALTIDERWTLRVYARNLLDSDGAITRSLSRDALSRPNYILVTPVQPRTVGLAVETRF
ncbi:MAG: TonB-dependent receptor domain-containing protein [Sphingobium sp.]